MGNSHSPSLMGRHFISALFACELFSACVALVILFADSAQVLFGFEPLYMKLAILVLSPMTWMELSSLSWISAIGVISFLNLIGIVVIDGSTGVGPSWWKPAPTMLWPISFKETAMGLGLVFVGLDGF